jgi:uncharacterized protein (DUF885 family)
MELVHGGDWAGYRAEFGRDALDFSANVSPLGLPAGVAAAITAALPMADRYPDPLCRALRTKLAAAEGVDTAQILCGNGAADLIYRLALALRPRRALLPAPTFAEYAAALETVDCDVQRFLLREEKDFAVTDGFVDAIDDSTDAVAMLKDLRKKISQDFPDIPAVSCEVKYIDNSLKDYLSPAFYLTPPIDQYTENVIYLNPAENCRGLSLYTTLAHEGYPGHLFQTVSFHAQSPAPLRFLLAPGGYTEGWATYVEMYAYSLWDGGSDTTVVQQKNRAFSLGLAALLDIGIHYHGYSLADVSAFLTKLGFNASGASSLYRAILQAPANYLQYYVGYLNFQRLRSTMQQALQEHFVLRDFHTAVLDAGPAPFSILEKLVAQKLGVTVS